MVRKQLMQNLRSAESAAIAGVLYSILTIAALLLLRTFPVDAGRLSILNAWFDDASNRQQLIIGMNLAAVSAVAFLWFVAVIRRRMGDREDKFFSTVFLGSAILYVALWMVAAAAVSSVAVAYQRFGDASVNASSATFLVGFAEALVLIVGPRLQGVFVLSTSTLILRTAMLPKWLAYLGYALGLVMVLIPVLYQPTGLAFPLWVLTVSVTILGSKLTHTSSI